MKSEEPFSLIERIKSFEHSFRGLKDILKTEHNAWIHSFMTLSVLAVCFWVELEAVRFSLIILCIMGVWAAEAFNTVFEILVDFISPEYSTGAKRAKDIAAAGVLFASFGACVIGFLILGPPLWHKLTSLFS